MDQQDFNDLQTSLEQYENQLSQITAALSAATNGAERDTLKSLYQDIEELIKLTKENLEHIQNASGKGVEKPSSSSIDEEYALFQAEISAVAGTVDIGEKSVNERTGNSCDKSHNAMFEEVKNDLKSLEGLKCQAPHSHSWGSTSYHNAIIAGIESADDIHSVEDIQVRVLFTNPTDKDMLPCTRYFQGECRFADEDCWFSHGNVVRFSDLKEYSEPDFSLVNPGIKALVKGADNLWAHAQIIKINNDRKCEIKFETNGINTTVDLHDILPLVDKDVSTMGDDTGSDDSEADTEKQPLWDRNMVERALNNPSTSALGEWEKHTKGIGSRLMAQMGYVTGSGLGKFGEGRIEPVEAVILPAGKSLDHCMNLKEKAGGEENLFSVEKRLAKSRKKQEIMRKKQFRDEKGRRDIFDFINISLSGNKHCIIREPVGKAAKIPVKSSLKSESTRGLNVASFNISEDIRRVERELASLNESLSRHNKGSATYNTLLAKQTEKKKQLNVLKSSGIAVDNERNQRSDYKKMTVF